MSERVFNAMVVSLCVVALLACMMILYIPTPHHIVINAVR